MNHLEGEAFRKKYRAIKTVGKGSFGEAVLVRSVQDGGRYICKVIDTSNMNVRELRDVSREVALLGGVNHPNIVQYHEHFSIGDVMFLIMEYADGSDLASKIKEQKKKHTEGQPLEYFSTELIWSWFLQLSVALKYLHDRKILHRDLKTANVFLMKNNTVKLGDFGISTALQNTLACTSTICGTPYYFSPEICYRRPYNNKSDVWSLGVLLFEMTALSKPFLAPGLRELMKVIVRGKYEPLPPQTDATISFLISKLLTLNPTERPSINQVLAQGFVQDELKKYRIRLDTQHREQQDCIQEMARTGSGLYDMASAPVASSPVASSDDKKNSATPKKNYKDQLSALRQLSRDAFLKLVKNEPKPTTPEPGSELPAVSAPLQEDINDDDIPSLKEAQKWVTQCKDLMKNIDLILESKAKLEACDNNDFEGGEEDGSTTSSSSSKVPTIQMPDGAEVPANEAKSKIIALIGAQKYESSFAFVSNMLSSNASPSQAQEQFTRWFQDPTGRTTSAVLKVIMWDCKQI